ncbi:MAG: CNNM domain-containing protein [bacterium]
MLLIEFISLIVLLGMSAFFSASETAIFHLPVITIDKLVYRYKNLQILKRRELLLGTLLFGSTLVNVSASIISGQIVYLIFHNSYLLAVTCGMTYILLVFGEVAPKLYSLRNAEKIAIKATPFLNILRYILSPVVFPLETLISFISPKKQSNFSKEEFKTFIQSDKQLSMKAQRIILNLLEFKNFTAKDLMTPITQLECLEDSTIPDKTLVAKLKHSRIPVYENDIANIKGIFYVKDMLKTNNNEKYMPLKQLMRVPCFVEKSTKASEVFTEFNRRHIHIAVVTDDSKKTLTVGIITMDDILKTIILSASGGK